MITDNLKKPLSIICLILMIVVSLSACSDRYDSYEHIFSDLEKDYNDTNEPKPEYVLIIPSDISPELYREAQAFCSDIETKTNAEVELKYDYEKLDEDSYDKLILLGRTSLEKSESFLSSFRINDYGYLRDKNTILIGGASSHATAKAIDAFRKNILSKANKDFLITDGTKFVFNDTYEIKNIFLNGFELSDYTLVYPRGNTDIYELTLKFRNSLAEKSGYYLNVKADSDIPKEKRAISVGNTSLCSADLTELSKTDVKLVEYSTGISLISGSNYTANKALDELLNIITAKNDSDTVNAHISSEPLYLFDRTELKITEIPLGENRTSINDIITIAEFISQEQPDLIRLTGASKNSAENILASLGEKYKMLMLYGDSERGVYHIYCKNEHQVSIESLCDSNGLAISKITYRSVKNRFVFDIYDLFCDGMPTTIDTASAKKLLNNAIIDSVNNNVLIFGTTEEASSLSPMLDGFDRLSDGVYSSADSFIESTVSENKFKTLLLTLYY